MRKVILWKLRSLLLIKPIYQRRNEKGGQKYLATSENGNIAYQNLGDTAKAMLDCYKQL
jgi:hypothetical protein